MNTIESQAPEMPGFYNPNYREWETMLNRFTPDEQTSLIGHSCGGGFLIRWLTENSQKVNKVILVAPWLDLNKNIDPDFFNFVINSNISSQTKELVIMYSLDDHPEIIESVEVLKKKLTHVKCIEFTDKDHFVLNSLNSEKFPELLQELMK